MLSSALKKLPQRVLPQRVSGPAFARTFNRTVVAGGDKPTTFRQDSLLVACTIAALTYYVPQDLVFLSLLGMNKKTETGMMGGKKKCANPHAAFAEWKAARPLCAKTATCFGSGSCYQASV
mmetsp:Transcript_22352/g.56498  ORF Transcript_22352/g.56498 Transcript_22352/m.56498 type:complete len:121 (+) Transcript_22352:310-672(+)|eukprot:g16884.t1